MWQPIETAPKDKWVLLYCPRQGVVRGWWNDCRHSSKPSPYWTHDRERMYGVRETRDDQPTHWMPLPDAPGAQAQPAPSFQEGWLRVIDEALVVTHLGVANADDSYEDAKRKLGDLIGWHIDVATDPAVNGGFKLVPADTEPAPSGLFYICSMCISDLSFGQAKGKANILSG